VIPKPSLEKEVAAMGPLVNKKRRKRDNEGAEANAPPKLSRKDHAAFRPAQSILGGTSLVPMRLDTGFTISAPATQDAPTAARSLSDPNPLSYARPQPPSEQGIAQKSGVREINLLPIRGRVTSRYLSAGVERNQQLSPGYPGHVSRHGGSHSTTDVAMGSQLRLRFKQEVRLLKKAKAKIARRDQRIQAREEEVKRLDQEIKSLMVVEVEAKNAELAKEMESLRVQFSDLQVSNIQLSQQVSNVQAQVTGEEKVKAAFEEFKRYEDDRVEQRCAKMDARLDKLSVDFDEALYPHMLTAIAGLVKGMSEGLKYGIEHGRADRDLVAIEAYDPEADKVLLEDAIAANKSRAEKKKKCRVVCHTHGVGSAHHARSDGIPASVPTITPRGLAILFSDVATQIEVADKEDEPYSRLQRSISLLPFYNLEWK
nr:hypothetical protein [Tanacetum cinerariifolium]